MEKINKKNKHSFLIVLIITLFVSVYLLLVVYNYLKVKEYDNKVFPNVYLEQFKLDNYDFNKLNDQINFYNSTMDNLEVTIEHNNVKYKYTYGDLGLSLDNEKIINNIREYQAGLRYSNKLTIINSNTKKVFPYVFKVDDNILNKFLINFNSKVSNINIENASLEINNYARIGIKENTIIEI